MKKSKIIISLLIIALFFLSGCVIPYNSSPGTRSASVGTNSGIVTTFLPNNPPSDLFPNNPFEIIVNLENKGEYDVPGGKTRVVLAGLNPHLFGIAESSVVLDTPNPFRGVKQIGNTVIPGEITRVPFESVTGYKGPLPGDSPFAAIVKVCYEYKTRAQSTICVTSLRTTQGDAVCSINSPKTITSTGAPIRITKIEQLPMGQSATEVTLGFNLQIENKAKGQPFLSALDTCASINYDDLNKVTIESMSIDNAPYKLDVCKEGVTQYQKSCCWFDDDSKSIQLIDGVGKILCQVTTSSAISYEGQLQMTLNYNYAEQTTKGFTVRKIGF